MGSGEADYTMGSGTDRVTVRFADDDQVKTINRVEDYVDGMDETLSSTELTEADYNSGSGQDGDQVVNSLSEQPIEADYNTGDGRDDDVDVVNMTEERLPEADYNQGMDTGDVLDVPQVEADYNQGMDTENVLDGPQVEEADYNQGMDQSFDNPVENEYTEGNQE